MLAGRGGEGVCVRLQQAQARGPVGGHEHGGGGGHAHDVGVDELALLGALHGVNESAGC